MIEPANLAESAHRKSSALLRRWLAETHTPVSEGPVELVIGPLRVRTEVTYQSPSGGHAFDAPHVVDEAGRPVAPADPGVLAAACSAAARVRAVPDAPINTSPGSLVAWFLRSLRMGEPIEPETAPDGSAQQWLATHVDNELTRALTNAETTLLADRTLPSIGGFGRRGQADERELLHDLGRSLRNLADRYPLAGHWLTSTTLTARALVNGSGLRYGETGELEPPTVYYETPNPLRESDPLVPGVPVPEPGDGWSLRPVRLEDRDVSLVQEWMSTEHVAVNWGQAWSWQRWRDELAGQLGGAHSLPCIAGRNGHDVAYLELYRVQRDPLSRCYPYHPHDLGVHIAIGEKSATGRGFGTSLLRAVAEGLLTADPECLRVVAEPNVHNEASIAAFQKAGFHRDREVGLPHKNSALMMFSRE